MDRSIAAYVASRLKPELGIEALGRCLKDGQRRRVYEAVSSAGPVIVKIYHPRRARQARNAEVAHGRFGAAGVGVPRLLLSDAGKDAAERFGLCCAVQERVEGRGFSVENPASDDDLLQIAAVLAAIHSDMGDACDTDNSPAGLGLPAKPESGDLWRDFVMKNIERRLGRLLEGDSEAGRGTARELLRWFEARGSGDADAPGAPEGPEAPGAGIAGASLLHWDFSPSNVIRRADGRLVVLDLDKSLRGLYGMELIRLVLRFALRPEEVALDNPTGGDAEGPGGFEGFWRAHAGRIDPPLAAYFEATPVEFARDWDRHRDFYLAWGMTSIASTLSRDSGRADLDESTRGMLARRAAKLWGELSAATREA